MNKHRNNEKTTANFRLAMLEKLNENNHKKHWNEAGIGWLFSRLEDEIKELKFELSRILYNDVMFESIINQIEMAKRECADVANMAMMIYDNLSNGILSGSENTEYLEPEKE